MNESSGVCREMIQIDLNAIATVNWSEEMGEKLRAYRLKSGLSMSQLVSRIQNTYSYPVTKQYIQMVERPTGDRPPKTVSFELLRYICTTLGADVRDLYESPKISQKMTNGG